MIRAAVKFCGGCDPSFDRSRYWEAIREEAQGRIGWCSLDEQGYQAALIVNGCETACLDRDLESGELVPDREARLVSIRDDGLAPAQVVEKLLEPESGDEE